MKKTFPLIIFWLALVGCQATKKPALTIAAAANVQFAMQELVASFTQLTGIDCRVVSGSSGKLTAQIKEGAPYDLFVSANKKYPEELYRSGLTTAAPQVYAFGKLVLWSAHENVRPSISALADKSTQYIAMANPKTAPYGMAAVEALQYYGLIRAVEKKIVFGESISQANQFILSKTVDFGFTAKSVVLSPKVKGRGQWIEIEQPAYAPIAQGVVVFKNGKVNEASKFYHFLFSRQAKIILKKYGYHVEGL
ncbi:MAG TPA: molybdate ABC transporter substrate-binding protein [Bacteroidetes bacterium]|nr:molybdate ABC transporter substrate-binding protein [Bacteroidota bacterium]